MAHCGGPDLDGPAASVSQAVWKPEWPEWPKGRTPKGNGDFIFFGVYHGIGKWPKGRTPKGKGDLPSGFWVLGLEAEDVVAGEQNIERQ